MPLANYSLDLLRKLMRKLERDPDCGRQILCFSCPDLVISEADLTRTIGAQAFSKLSWRPDSAGIIEWHQSARRQHRVADTWSLFESMGWQMTAIDAVPSRGREEVFDLSEPFAVDSHHRGRYDLLFDVITNQVFNVGIAMENALDALRVGGVSVHVIPMAMVNQGFWSVSPTMYYDFAEANGMAIVHYEALIGMHERTATTKVDRAWRCKDVPDGTLNFAAMRKQRPNKAVWPRMTKFRLHPTIKRGPDTPDHVPSGCPVEEMV